MHFFVFLLFRILDKAKSVSISADSSSAVTEGDTRGISCSANGNPDPVLTLYRSDGEETTQLFSATSTLVYEINIGRQINGENFYCEATVADTSIPLQYSKLSAKTYYTVKCKHIYFPYFFIKASHS